MVSMATQIYFLRREVMCHGDLLRRDVDPHTIKWHRLYKIIGEQDKRDRKEQERL